MLLNFVNPSDIDNWLRVNAAATSTRRSTKDNWRAYLAANGGTGNSIDELEHTYLRAQGKTGTMSDAWSKQLAGTGTLKDKMRSTYK